MQSERLIFSLFIGMSNHRLHNRYKIWRINIICRKHYNNPFVFSCIMFNLPLSSYVKFFFSTISSVPKKVLPYCNNKTFLLSEWAIFLFLSLASLKFRRTLSKYLWDLFHSAFWNPYKKNPATMPKIAWNTVADYSALLSELSAQK